MDVTALCAAWSGAPLRERVRAELRATRDLVGALAETLACLDAREREAFDRLSAEVHVLAAERELWDADGGAVARDVCARYAALLSYNGRIVEAPECLAALRGVLLSIAFLVATNRAVRRFSGIRKRFFRW
jgi:hypothetical protein